MVARSLEFTARVAPVQQAELFFRAAGHLSRLLVQRDAEVHEGDLLAELEMADRPNPTPPTLIRT